MLAHGLLLGPWKIGHNVEATWWCRLPSILVNNGQPCPISIFFNTCNWMVLEVALDQYQKSDLQKFRYVIGTHNDQDCPGTLYLIYIRSTWTTYMYRGRPLFCILARYLGRCKQLHTITSRSPNPFSQPAVSIATSIFKVLHRNGLLPSQFLKHRSNITGGCSFLYPRILLKILPEILLGQRVSCFMSVVISIPLGISISKQFNYTYNIQYVTYVTYVACQSPIILYYVTQHNLSHLVIFNLGVFFFFFLSAILFHTHVSFSISFRRTA